MKQAQTKSMREVYARYRKSWHTNLDDCYNNYSCAKVRAFEYCKDLCDKMGGYNLRIIGYNCMQFSVGFEFYNASTQKCFAYITANYDRFMIIEQGGC